MHKSLVLALLIAPTIAHPQTGIGQVGGSQGEPQFMFVAFNPLTGESTLQPGIHVGSTPSVITNELFDNTLQPAAGDLYSLLLGGTTLVDWGIGSEQVNTTVDQVTFQLGVDSSNPQVRLFLLNGYEGFDDVDASVTELVLPAPLPADTINPGDGLSVPVQVVISIDPPLYLPSRCIGWAVHSVSGDVGPALVNTQCTPSAIGPGFGAYEANPITNNFTAIAGATDLLSSITGASNQTTFQFAQPDGFELFELVEPVRASTSGMLIQSAANAGFNNQCSAPFTQNAVARPVLLPFLDDLSWDGSSATGLFTRIAADGAQTFSWEGLTSNNPGTPNTPGLNFQTRLIPHGDRIEFHYGAMSAGLLGSGTSATIGLTGPNGTEPVIIGCNQATVTQNATAWALTRGEMPVANGVTNKLVAFSEGGGSTPLGAPFDVLASQGDLDGAGLGAIASMSVQIRRSGGCESESITIVSPGTPNGLEYAVSGSAAFGGSLQFEITDTLDRGYVFGIFVVSYPFTPLPTPFGTLAVNLSQTFLLDAAFMAQVGPVERSTYTQAIPPFDANLCGTTYHTQGAIFLPGNPAILAQDFGVFTIGL